MVPNLPVLADYPNLSRLVGEQLACWPEHAKFMGQRFDDDANAMLPFSEELASLILKLAGDELGRYCADYRWMCDNFVREEIHFRRTGEYRLKTFQEAYDAVYGNPGYMERYLKGILLSQVLWHNQVAALDYYVNGFLPGMAAGSDYLEIGPGHGLFTYFASRQPNCGSLSGWDASVTSIQSTRHALKTLGVTRDCRLELRNILDPPSVSGAFDCVTISEVMEHLDQPEKALDAIFAITRPNGRVYINVPTNSPAPDHIYLWRSPEEVVDLVVDRGFRVEEWRSAPTTGYSEESARKKKLTVNSMIIAVRP